MTPDIWTMYAVIIGTVMIILYLRDKWLEKHKFSITYEPDPGEAISVVDAEEHRIKVRFFCKKGNVVVYRIWQHHGGEIGNAKMEILEAKSKGGILVNDHYFFTIEENIPKEVILVFKKTKYTRKDNGFRIETSDGVFEREFDFNWVT